MEEVVEESHFECKLQVQKSSTEVILYRTQNSLKQLFSYSSGFFDSNVSLCTQTSKSLDLVLLFLKARLIVHCTVCPINTLQNLCVVTLSLPLNPSISDCWFNLLYTQLSFQCSPADLPTFFSCELSVTLKYI